MEKQLLYNTVSVRFKYVQIGDVRHGCHCFTSNLISPVAAHLSSMLGISGDKIETTRDPLYLLFVCQFAH